jgi:cytochrome b561
MSTPFSAAERPDLLHWVSAILITMLLLIGFFVFTGTTADFPNLATILLLHMSGGAVVLILIAVRIASRARRRVVARRTGDQDHLEKLTIVQWALYAVIVLMVATGFATAVMSGLNLAVFGGDTSQLMDEWPRLGSLSAHRILAGLLVGLLALHILQAGRQVR